MVKEKGICLEDNSLAVIANNNSTGGLVELVSLSGGKGDAFPAHKHEGSHDFQGLISACL
jgi:hypothetical protein